MDSRSGTKREPAFSGTTESALRDSCGRKFALDRYGAYPISEEARALIDAAPKQQVVAPGNRLGWHAVDLNGWSGDLGKVIRLVQTVRNNLFHAGKHGADGWDDPVRTAMLLEFGIAVLVHIAEETHLDGDYWGFY